MKTWNSQRTSKIKSRLHLFSVCAAALLMLTACSTTKRVVPARPESLSGLRADGTLVVLQPRLVYESAGEENPLSGALYGCEDLAADLVQSAVAGLEGRSGRVVADKSYQTGTPDLARLAGELSAGSDQLLRAAPPAGLLAELRAFGGGETNTAVLVQCLKTKIGPRGSWDPNTGAITSTMHSGHLRAAILDCQTGRALWRNEFYLREIPRVESKHYRQAVNSLYRTQQ
jgi:hypothetical protein